MPPKKRAKGRKKKVQVTQEDEDAGKPQSSSGKALERKKRAEELLSDLDSEAGHRYALLDKSLTEAQKKIKAYHKQLLIKIPKFVQEMSLRDFLAVGGDIQKAMEQEVAKSKAGAVDSRDELLEEPKLLVDAAAVAASSQAGALTTREEMDTTMDTTSRILETPAIIASGARPRRRAAQAANIALSARPARKTQAATRQDDLMLQDTPAQTPSFRPGLPMGKRDGKKTGKAQRARMVTMSVREDMEGRLKLANQLNVWLRNKLDFIDPLEQEQMQDLQKRLAEVFGKPSQ